MSPSPGRKRRWRTSCRTRGERIRKNKGTRIVPRVSSKLRGRTGGVCGIVRCPSSMSPKENAPLAGCIFMIRGRRVILDSDLAHLYGVTTKRFNEAFKRNAPRFPADFAFQLTVREYATSRSRVAASGMGATQGKDPGNMWSQIATTSTPQRRRLSSRPWAFTEHGAVMAANVLRSGRAVEMSVYVVRAFIRQREEVATNASILRRLAEIDRNLLEHDAALQTLWKKLQPLLAPPLDPSRRRIGFHAGDR